MRYWTLALLAAGLALPSAPLEAQGRDVPYWASIKVDRLHMRVGPNTTYRIDWVYKRRNLPVKVVRREEGWRLVEDPDGTRGWVLGRFLSRARTAIVNASGLSAMREGRSAQSKLLWKLETGVIGQLRECEAGWCRFDVGERSGFVSQDAIWGAGKPDAPRKQADRRAADR